MFLVGRLHSYSWHLRWRCASRCSTVRTTWRTAVWRSGTACIRRCRSTAAGPRRCRHDGRRCRPAPSALNHAVRRAGVLRVPAYDSAVGVLHDAGSRLVFPAAEPDLAVKLLQQLLVAEVRCHRRTANHPAEAGCKCSPQPDRRSSRASARRRREGVTPMDVTVHAFIQNLRRGHYELAVDSAQPFGWPPHSTNSEPPSDGHGPQVPSSAWPAIEQRNRARRTPKQSTTFYLRKVGDCCRCAVGLSRTLRGRAVGC